MSGAGNEAAKIGFFRCLFIDMKRLRIPFLAHSNYVFFCEFISTWVDQLLIKNRIFKVFHLVLN